MAKLPLHDRYDTVVIGAGMSGLAAGIRLAQAGSRVAVLERHSLWGGLNSFYKKSGRRWDVGLHALTNFVPKGKRGHPLSKVLRQLRVPYDALRLGEQHGSRTVFPDAQLCFSNDFELLRSQVHEAFPTHADGFDRLASAVADTPIGTGDAQASARAYIASYVNDPLLIDLLLHPLLWYGSPTPMDMDHAGFVVLWKSVYEEGFARPAGGMRPLLDVLRARLAEEGGDLRTNCGVAEILHGSRGVTGVRLDNGGELETRRVLSSAGWVETMALSGTSSVAIEDEAGRISFVECCAKLDTKPAELGHGDTIVFYNLAERTIYDAPETGHLELRSGVLCCPDNYADQLPDPEGTARITVLASPRHWIGFDDDAYAAAKAEAFDGAFRAVQSFAPNFLPHVTVQDSFTPRTITHFTGKRNGAVYGAPKKRPDGATPVDGLHLIGTDQGLLGIVGAMMSGIQVANHHVLAPTTT
jgi:phytoene dehydrogenase-like protein